jgi:hypothetical protein
MASQEERHEPLGQVIEGDSLRGKYAAPIRGRTKKQSGTNGEAYLDEKSTQQILDMTKEQELEMQAEEQNDWRQKNQQEKGHQAALDSDEEEEEEIEEVFIDEADE